MNRKFKMPSVQELLNKKIIYDAKKEPVWDRLEKEMQDNLAVKPYNEKVGAWLHFLRDLKFYFYCQSKSKERRLKREIGPSWYIEYSTAQRAALASLKHVIHQDVLEDVTRRIRIALSDLGITLKLSRNTLMNAMSNSEEDPGVFMWNLYKAVYKQSPTILRTKYDMNAMLIMSSLVFIDLEECIQRLEKLTFCELPPVVEKPPVIKKYFEPKVKYGVYLQKIYVPCREKSKQKEQREPAPIGYKFRLKNKDSLEKLCQNESFINKRKERNIKAVEQERICTYKFWEAPGILRSQNRKMQALAVKMRMVKKKAKLKFATQFKNVQPLLGTVAYTGGKANYVINNVAIMPTGYILINSGINYCRGDYVTSITGFWKYPTDEANRCHKCTCMAKWEERVLQYLNESKCKCGHFYDFYHTAVREKKRDARDKEKYFKPPNRHGPHAFDDTEIYQLDPKADFIKNTVRDAVRSAGSSSTESEPTLNASVLKSRDLLATFLADLSDTPLIIPHLPEANLLNSLLEWTRKRVKGKITPKESKRMMLTSQRRWLELKHMDFRARAYRIPFTLKELENMKWSYRSQIQGLFETLMNDFISRNRMKLVERTNLWWSTMKYDVYPSQNFLDTYFSYMPSRTKDTFLINPYSSNNTVKYGGKTCPLNL